MALACVLSLSAGSRLARAAPTGQFRIHAAAANTWSQDGGNVIQLRGPVTIQTDRATLSADAAVIWLTPLTSGAEPRQEAKIALIGHAVLKEGSVTREGRRLLVTTEIDGGISLTAEERTVHDASATAIYQEAAALAASTRAAPAASTTTAPTHIGPMPTTAPTSAATTSSTAKVSPVTIRFRGTLQQTQTDQGKVAVLVDGGVLLFQRRQDGDFLELRARRAVIFTTLTSLRGVGQEKIHSMGQAVSGVYLEGNVRIEFVPHQKNRSPQRLQADRVYYDLENDRAILTDAVVHTVDPALQIPLILRAKSVRQLAQGQYDARKAVLTTSAFATPTYSIAASEIDVRQRDTGNPNQGMRTTFIAHDATFNVLDFPVFYFPLVGGSLTQREFPLRQFGISNSSRFGTGVETEWGVLEALGLARPPGFDLAARLDYFSDRGPAVGLSGRYSGGFVTQAGDPWDYSGDFQSYFVHDDGVDDLKRGTVVPDRVSRGQFLWEHQHFFPGDWQLQVRMGYVTDPTFLEEWFPRQFDNGLPYDMSVYLKRQRDSEASTFLLNAQPRDFVTTADALQNQFEVEHLPEFGYHRIGDSFGDDQFTFFSDDSLSRLQFHKSDVPLSELGFAPGISPGMPSLGLTGTPNAAVYRANFRQEVDYPTGIGPIRMVPYVMGIYTGYTDSPDGSGQNRFYSGAGLRATTAFWKVDDSAQSDLFDIHRLRHVIEPEVNLFTSGTTVDRSNVYMFDDDVDAINDISAMQLALHQRWQTKRGGPGRWRSVDLFTWNIEANFFANQPPEALLAPLDFRGLYFPSLPETSIPRNGINNDFTWRVSDTTSVLGDAAYNLDESKWATAAIGLSVQRDPRVSYYLGTRYIGDLHSNIATFAINYQLTEKYAVAFSQSFDFAQRDDVGSSLVVTRRFDRFFLAVRVYHNSIDSTSGITVNLIPEGVPGRILNNIQGAFAGR